MPGISQTAGSFNHSSPIVNFYNGKSVFITGATGYLGTVLVEKLLFSCNGINKIYVLIKRNEKTVEERFSEYLNSMAFQRIRDKDPALLKKIIPICGNLEEKKLGISETDIEILQEEVSVVFHSAACLLFNMSLAAAVDINTRPTEQLIALCKQMRNIAVFVYVSTAYSNANRQVIDEKVYETGVSLESVYSSLESNNTKGLLDYLLDGRPNTYTYSKALTEDLIQKEFYHIPTAIVRPSIIGSSMKEPIPGWLYGWNGLSRAIAGACKGLVLIWHGTPSVVLDVIPVDYVANLLIAVAWETSESRLIGEHGIKVFNYGSGLRNPITMDYIFYECIKHRKYFGSELTTFPRFRPITNYFIYKIWLFFYHIIPAFVIDFICWLTGKKPIMMKTLRKLTRLNFFLTYFSLKQFLFLDGNVRALLKKMTNADREIFVFDITKVEWENYLQHYVLGIAKYDDFIKGKRNILPVLK